MTDSREKLSATQVRDAGLVDWRQILGRIKARFRTGDFRTGLALVNKIGAAAEAANHHPDIQLTYSDVIVTLTSHDVGGITSRDLDLARQISSHAAELRYRFRRQRPDAAGARTRHRTRATACAVLCSLARRQGRKWRAGRPQRPGAHGVVAGTGRRRDMGAPRAAVRTTLALRRVGSPRRGRTTSAGSLGRRRAPGQRPCGAGVLGRRGRRRQPLLHLHTRRPLSSTGPRGASPARNQHPDLHLIHGLSR